MTPAPAVPALTVSGLTLSRGGRLVAEGLGFALAGGDVLFVRGANGAGKSSLLLALAGILRPVAGTVSWAGRPAPPLHYLGHAAGLKPRLTLLETLAFWQAVNGPGGTAVDAALAAVGLGGLGGIEAGHLSAGQGRRLALARLLVSPRSVWLLDEPATALDADGRRLVAGLLDAHAATGGLAVVATHDELPLAATAATLQMGHAP